MIKPGADGVLIGSAIFMWHRHKASNVLEQDEVRSDEVHNIQISFHHQASRVIGIAAAIHREALARRSSSYEANLAAKLP
jgi:hypothetical protein